MCGVPAANTPAGFSVGAQKIWAGTVSIQPNAKTGAHHHGELESVIYVVHGKARMRWGKRLEFTAEAGPRHEDQGQLIPSWRSSPFLYPSSHAARGWVCCCGSVGNALALSTDPQPSPANAAAASCWTAIGVRFRSAR